MRRAKLVDAVASAVAWYHERLLSAPDAAVARRYLRERGLTGAEVRAFQLGSSPAGWDTLVTAIRLPGDICERSDRRRVGHECVRTSRSRLCPYPSQHKKPTDTCP